nr:MAG TPA: hypothetical protein [Caudoviricetes sp.]
MKCCRSIPGYESHIYSEIPKEYPLKNAKRS